MALNRKCTLGFPRTKTNLGKSRIKTKVEKEDKFNRQALGLFEFRLRQWQALPVVNVSLSINSGVLSASNMFIRMLNVCISSKFPVDLYDICIIKYTVVGVCMPKQSANDSSFNFIFFNDSSHNFIFLKCQIASLLPDIIDVKGNTTQTQLSLWKSVC